MLLSQKGNGNKAGVNYQYGGNHFSVLRKSNQHVPLNLHNVNIQLYLSIAGKNN